MTSPSLSLGPVLDLIERWQRASTADDGELTYQLLKADIPALRALAAQHAAQLREIAKFASSTLFDVGLDHEIDWHCAVAADFLAPRRE